MIGQRRRGMTLGLDKFIPAHALVATQTVVLFVAVLIGIAVVRCYRPLLSGLLLLTAPTRFVLPAQQTRRRATQ
jgi:hypothetical protein